jgi:DNA-binding beta-propeller fold protein YncE
MNPDRRPDRPQRAPGLGPLLAALVVLAPAARALAGPASADVGFHVSQVSRIGGEGSWDYLQYDPARGRLFITRVGGVLVVDTATMTPIGAVPAFAGTRVHGVALAPELGLGVTSDGADRAATVFDLESLRPVRRIALPHSPDAILFDKASSMAVAFGEDEPVAMAFDPQTGKSRAEVKLPGSPESAVADGRGEIYVDLSDTGEVARFNTRTWTIDARWPIGGSCTTPTPMAMDRARGRLFIGCRSGTLAVVDVAAKALVANLPIGAGADTVAFDDKSGLVFVSCNDGTLSVFRPDSAGYALVQTVPTAFSARTMALDPERMRVFLPAADRGPMLPKVGDIPSRPAIVPETFRVLTVTR